MHYTLDDYLIVEAECCRLWPIAFGIPLGRCGLCRRVPVVKIPLVVIRQKVVHSEEEDDNP